MENTLNANIRPHASKGESHRLREHGRIPGNLYGMHMQNMLVEFAEMDVMNVLHNAGEHGVLKVNLGGSQENVLIKEVQRDPVSRKITHIDMQRVNNNEKIRARVPIMLQGEEYYRNSNTIVQQQVNEVEVECTPDKLPKYIVADVSALGGKHRISVGDLEVGAEISILNNPTSTVVSVTYSKNTATETESPSSANVLHADDTP